MAKLVSMTSGSIEDFEFAEESSSTATTSNLQKKPAHLTQETNVAHI